MLTIHVPPTVYALPWLEGYLSGRQEAQEGPLWFDRGIHLIDPQEVKEAIDVFTQRCAVGGLLVISPRPQDHVYAVIDALWLVQDIIEDAPPAPWAVLACGWAASRTQFYRAVRRARQSHLRAPASAYRYLLNEGPVLAVPVRGVIDAP